MFANYLSMLLGRNISGILSYSVTYFHHFMQIYFFWHSRLMIYVNVLPLLSVTRSKRLVRGLKSNHDRGLPKYNEIRETKLLRVHHISFALALLPGQQQLHQRGTRSPSD
jgi:hypothetical protein